MNLAGLNKIEPYCWEIPAVKGEMHSPVHLYGSEPLLASMDEKVREQITNVAKLPGLVGAAMTMPDAHWGYGFPIGGVAAFDPDLGGIISAGGVGFDISCGIRCLRTNLNLADVTSQAERLANTLFQRIPAGVGEEGALKLSILQLDDIMLGGAEWAIRQGYGVQEDLSFIEEHGRIHNAIPANVSDHAKKRQHGEMGTLGSGNHYLEVQVVDRIYDVDAARTFGLKEGQIVISIHCGSRGLGHQIGTEYLVSLAKAASRLGIELPDRELACAPINSPEGQEYLGAMNAAINVALANRQILTHLTREVFNQIFHDSILETLFDVSHNTCKLEKHKVDGKGRWLYIHRKGATRAFGPGHPALPERYKEAGQPVIIGGSMGTGSYVLAGISESENKAWSSASHGAGRAMSRHTAIKQWRGKELIEELASKGILIRTKSLRGAAEEAPGAYKDVDLVAEVTEKAGLAKRVAFLRPKVCIKG
ncbi:RtcB family protein [Sulfurirhabdus autotrophica]|uniref:tRNA-splicing ligase RtcB n=1 Tax=Sulfurirhabdus autotrophica TaxID=1706046 RepID=A0A4R3YD83_9PROT|nr:RtcB family protein [Sulfurirhabdus autotrophica]TCV90435.1 tRNA-splicing ligase RtcB [Sulfurirhabdus autotrophica]